MVSQLVTATVSLTVLNSIKYFSGDCTRILLMENLRKGSTNLSGLPKRSLVAALSKRSKKLSQVLIILLPCQPMAKFTRGVTIQPDKLVGQFQKDPRRV